MADRRPFGLVLPSIDEASLCPSVFGENNQWKILGRSLAANLQNTFNGPATVVLRSAPSPRLAILGWATPEEYNILESSLDLFVGSLSRFRYVDHAQAETDCGALATRLREEIGSRKIGNAVFAGIPRGGVIVLGLLSYMLDLSSEQLRPRAHPEAPLVVVDDCFLTGYQASRFLEDRSLHSEVVLAGLYAHPDLRSAIQDEHPSVRTCITARDLTDHAPDLYADDYPDWKARWASRDTGPRYWIGVPDHLCFPWSETDVGFWVPSSESLAEGWQVAPPGHCLNRRSEDVAAPVFMQECPSEKTEAHLSPGRDVFYAEVGDCTIVVHASSETCFVLEDAAADFWWALIEHGQIDNARDALLARYDVDQDVLETDLRGFVKKAVDRHLLDGPPRSSPS